MGFVYRILLALKALWIVLSEPISILRKLHKTNYIQDAPPPKKRNKHYYRFMYIAPSSGRELLNFNLLFKAIV